MKRSLKCDLNVNCDNKDLISSETKKCIFIVLNKNIEKYSVHTLVYSD